MAFRLLGAARTGAVLSLGLLGACIASSSKAADQTVVTTPAPPGAAVEILDRNHKLGPGDVIDVTTDKYPQFSRSSITLYEDGTIDFPVLLVVQAKGLTTAELRELITEGMKKELNHPRVTVELRHIYVAPKPPEVVIKHFIIAEGDVQHAGRVELPGSPLPLSQVLPLIGPGADADFSAIHIQYPPEINRPEHISDFSKFGYSESKLSPKDDILITGDETILVMHKPEIRKPDPTHFEVLGAVVHPGPLVSEALITLGEALDKAGGLTPGAEVNAVQITGPARKDAQGKSVPLIVDVEKYRKAGQTDQNPLIQPGDVINVHFLAKKVYVYGEVSHNGELDVKPEATVLQVFIEAQATLGTADFRVELIQENKKDPHKPFRTKIDVREIQKQKRPDVKMAQGDVLFVPHKGIVRNLMYYINSVTQPLWLASSASTLR